MAWITRGGSLIVGRAWRGRSSLRRRSPPERRAAEARWRRRDSDAGERAGSSVRARPANSCHRRHETRNGEVIDVQPGLGGNYLIKAGSSTNRTGDVAGFAPPGDIHPCAKSWSRHNHFDPRVRRRHLQARLERPVRIPRARPPRTSRSRRPSSNWRLRRMSRAACSCRPAISLRL
jgi:hypothetical protein